MRLDISLATLALFLVTGCSAPSQSMIDGWQLNRDGYDRTLIGELRKRVEAGDYKAVNGVVVVKDGKLLVEEYFNGETRETLHDPRSVGKTFASALLGIATTEGYIKSLDEPLSDFYDLSKYKNYSDLKSRTSLRQLLTMSSAFDGDDNVEASPGNEANMYPRPDWVEWALSLPIDPKHEAGKEWHYFTAGAVLIGDILDRKVPDGLERYADEKLFKPLGIARREWQYTPQRVPSTAGGLRLTALDLAKFGQLYKNGGVWNGRQVIPKAWVEASFQKYLKTAFPPNAYGYFWWNRPYEVNGKELETFYCSGNGGNKIFVFTDQPLVVVVTASAYNKPYMHRQIDDMMTKYILPAVLKQKQIPGEKK